MHAQSNKDLMMRVPLLLRQGVGMAEACDNTAPTQRA